MIAVYVAGNERPFDVTKFAALREAWKGLPMTAPADDIIVRARGIEKTLRCNGAPVIEEEDEL